MTELNCIMPSDRLAEPLRELLARVLVRLFEEEAGDSSLTPRLEVILFGKKLIPAMKAPSPDPVCRISISLPESVFQQLEQLVSERGFESRSQAIMEMINRELSVHGAKTGNRVMSGTITLLYDHGTRNLQRQLAAIQHESVDEVISSLHVLLEKNHIMEVILVQGPANKLKRIANDLITCKGVKWGQLNLVGTVMPPIHARTDD